MTTTVPSTSAIHAQRGTFTRRQCGARCRLVPCLRGHRWAQYPNRAGEPDDAVAFHGIPRTATDPDDPGVAASQMLVMVPFTCICADQVTGVADAGRTVTSAQKPLPQSVEMVRVTVVPPGTGCGAGLGAGAGAGCGAGLGCGAGAGWGAGSPVPRLAQ